jgi:hypothetical protein
VDHLTAFPLDRVLLERSGRFGSLASRRDQDVALDHLWPRLPQLRRWVGSSAGPNASHRGQTSATLGEVASK